MITIHLLPLGVVPTGVVSVLGGCFASEAGVGFVVVVGVGSGLVGIWFGRCLSCRGVGVFSKSGSVVFSSCQRGSPGVHEPPVVIDRGIVDTRDRLDVFFPRMRLPGCDVLPTPRGTGRVFHAQVNQISWDWFARIARVLS